MKLLTIATGRRLDRKRVENIARNAPSPALSETVNSVCHASPKEKRPRNSKPPEHGAFMQFIIATVMECLASAGALELRCNVFINDRHGTDS
jgi:hypothetical protein